MSRRARVPGTLRPRRTVRALALVADPSQAGLTPAERLALTLRAEATATGRCACGASWKAPRALRAAEVVRVRMEHEPDCPASDGPHFAALARRLGTSLRFRSIVLEFEVTA